MTSQLRVDLSRLTDLAVTGWRAIRDSTQQFRDRGGRVQLLEHPVEVKLWTGPSGFSVRLSIGE
ncbi:MAG TPA: hypothetical protein VGP03_07150 [Pseudonocardiaceae bacterium]|jgi:hypothetical protein|nr:hypothetical protein [Pseudonocardiaceae bacterium]